MVTISLTTDWGLSGLYTGLFKAKLVQRLPGAQIVDISHSIAPFKVEDAVYALRNAYKFFPHKSIHVVSIASMNIADRSKNREIICFQYKYQYFIGPNNGLWEMLLDTNPDEVYKLTMSRQSVGNFPEADAIVDTISKLSMGVLPEKIGEPIGCIPGRKIGVPMISEKQIVGHLLFFDAYGNGITNITEETFETVRKNRPFTIMIGSERNKTDEISQDYDSSKPENTIVALFNVSGFLEIAVPYFPLEKLLPVDTSTRVLIQFYETEEDKNQFRLI